MSVTLHIDGRAVTVPKGTSVIRAAEQIGIAIPRFCDHPLLDPVAACRECMVEVPDAGNGRSMKPQPACALEAQPNMVVETASEVALQAQQGMLEFLLINHPLDCPMCDKGGECPLQNQSLSTGRGVTRYDGVKRRFPKPITLTQMLLLDRERCVLCQRCTRFGDQISGDQMLCLVERGAKSQIGRGPSAGTISYFAGNLAQICPVGALTSVDYRFQARPFDIVSTVTTCDNCAAGCALRVDQRHGEVKRRLAASDDTVNQEWNCDKGRFAFRSHADRLTTPLVRREDGELHPATWPVALAVAAAGLDELGPAIGVLPGGRLSLENAVAYARFARILGSDSIDARTRRGATAEEASFLTRQLARPGISYDAIAAAQKVVLVAFEPEDECPMLFLTLRRGVRKAGCHVVTIAPFASPGSRKLSAELVATAPGDEIAALRRIGLDAGTVVLVGERASNVPGLLPAVETAAFAAGAKLAWVPRRAGEWGALTAGCLPVKDGQDAPRILAAAARGEMGLVIGGVDPYGMDNLGNMWSALEHAPFIISLEQRASDITWAADVVLPVALLDEQAGNFLSWTGELRPIRPVVNTKPMTDRRVLDALASRLGRDIGVGRLADATRLGVEAQHYWASTRLAKPAGRAPAVTPAYQPGGARLATWRTLLVGSRCLDNAATLVHRPPQVVMGPALATAIGLKNGQTVIVGGPDGTRLSAPVAIDETTAAGAVWVPDAPWPAGANLSLAVPETKKAGRARRG